MLRRRVGAFPNSRPLRCERCRQLRLSARVVVKPGLEERVLNGRVRDHAMVSCTHGHTWWSVHPDALRQARKAAFFAHLTEPATNYELPLHGSPDGRQGRVLLVPGP
jgi:hypothetical protein